MRSILLAAVLTASATATPPITVPCSPGVTVTYDPFVCQGEAVQVKITNSSGTTFAIAGNCAVRMGPAGCTGPWFDTCNIFDWILASGSSISLPVGVSTVELAPGPYSLRVSYKPPGAAISCCLPITVQPGVSTYGQGGVGIAGVAPVLSAMVGGAGSVIGNAALEVYVGKALGGAPAWLIVGADRAETPTAWGTLLVDLTAPFFVFPIQLEGTPGTADGHLTIPAPIPNVPSLVGTSSFLQVVVADPSSIGGFSHTQGLQISICD